MQFDMPMSQGRQLPSFYLREIDFPEVNLLEVGGTCYVVMKVELVGKRAAKSIGINNGNDGNKMEGEFQMLSIKKMSPDESKSVSSKEYQHFATKVKSGNT